MQSEAYTRKVKITNLQQMANTLIYIQEHGYNTRENLTAATSEAHKDLNDAQKRLRDLNAAMKTLNAQIHYTGQYFASKIAYAEFLKSKRKKKYRSEHASKIIAYEEARDWLKDFYPDGKILSLKSLKSRKKELQEMISSQKLTLQNLKVYCKELDTVSYNTDAILTRHAMETEQIPEHLTTHHKSQKERKEYTGDNQDRLSSFKVAASLQGCTPQRALVGVIAKHIVSLYDMCYAKNELIKKEMWKEKIIDGLNYLFLLVAVIREEAPYEQD